VLPLRRDQAEAYLGCRQLCRGFCRFRCCSCGESRLVGFSARLSIEALLGTRVYLALHVNVRPRWREDPELLARTGVVESSGEGAG
jgi:hypothetical protein